MATKNKRIDRQRQLRQKSRQAEFHRRQLVVDPQHCLHACLVTGGWEDKGLAAIYIARDIAPGRVTMFNFLVDLWGMGLKDAWGECDIASSEFDEKVDELRDQLDLASLPIDTARHMVYGGIRRAQELGFRLPKRYERWTAVLGPLPPGESPDMSLFGCDGKIVFVCNQRDLEARLVGTSIDKLLARPDVEFVLGKDDFTLVNEDDDKFMDQVSQMDERLVNAVRSWCFANGKMPHPILPEVVSAMTEAAMQAGADSLGEDGEFVEPPTAEQERSADSMTRFLRMTFSDRLDELEVAFGQILGFQLEAGSTDRFEEMVMSSDGANAKRKPRSKLRLV